jgi:hypothetical protein
MQHFEISFDAGQGKFSKRSGLENLMRQFCFVNGLAVFAVLALAGSPASAFFHLWDFTEFFSSADGNVQFIELGTTGLNEIFASGIQIRSTSNTFTFPANLAGPTTNKRLLIATAGFGSLPGGVVPDFTLASDFFNPAGDTIRLCQSTCTGLNVFHTRTFASVPTDGQMSRNYPTDTLATNSPRNYAGATGSVNLSPPMPTGDYNGNGTIDAADYVLWRDTDGQNVAVGSGADGDGDGTIDAGDYDFWRARFGNAVPGSGFGAGSIAVPEPTAAILLTAALCWLALGRRR